MSMEQEQTEKSVQLREASRREEVHFEDRCGIRVCHTEKFKTARFSVLFSVPAVADTRPAASADWQAAREPFSLSRLLLILTARRGTEQYPNLAQINRRLDDLYAATLSCRHFFDGDRQVLGFTAEYIEPCFLPDGTDPLGGVCEMIAQLLLHPLRDADGLLRRETLASEKRAMLDSIRAIKNDTRAYAEMRCRELLFAGQPNDPAVMRSEKAVRAVTAEMLDKRQRELLDAAACTLFYTGRESAQSILARIHPQILAWGTRLPVPTVTAIGHPTETKRVEEEMAVTQSILVMGFCAPQTCVMGKAEYHAFLVLNEMFGAMGTNRLFLRLREQMGLCYSIGSTVDCKKATLTVSCGIGAAAQHDAEDAISDELQKIARGDFSEEELLTAKQSIDNAFAQMEDNAGAMESFLYTRLLDGIAETPEACRQAIWAVDREGVMQVAARTVLGAVFFLRGTLSEESEESEEMTEDLVQGDAYEDGEI